MLERFFQRLWSAIVTTTKFVGKCMKAITDAAGISGLPLHAIKGDASLAHAAKDVTQTMVSKATLTKIGSDVQCIAAKGVTLSNKRGLTKVAGLFAKVVATHALGVGTVVVGLGLTILFVGAVWTLKRTVKKAEKCIDTLSSVEDTAVTIGDFADAAA
jgi:hypothetical protein